MVLSDQELVDESETTDSYDSDDSQEDPTFDDLEETRLTLSNLSINWKIKPRGRDGRNEEPDMIEMDVPELNEQDKKSDEQDKKCYETIEKIINGSGVEKLKVEQCKIYLRKHGLRLSGNKGTLILRIKEHINILNGGGERKYPKSSFVLNCKGDACTGDVVMFEQNVYEMFNVASRSANGPPCGTRTIAGRIAKESYGAAKQQHTFTIEVLWSKGERPLPPLHPLLIKGRNLYRLKTMRQKWEDEGGRDKILSEKHSRGGVARLNREARVQHKEMRKLQKINRSSRNENLKKQKMDENKKSASHSASVTAEEVINRTNKQDFLWKTKLSGKCSEPNIRNHQPKAFLGKPEQQFQQRHPLTSTNHVSHASFSYLNPIQGCFHHENHKTLQMNSLSEIQTLKENRGLNHCTMIPPEIFHHHNNHANGQSNFYNSRNSGQNHAHPLKENGDENMIGPRPVWMKDGYAQKQQTCRYYAKGTCYFEERCKYFHGLAENKS